MLCQSHIVSPAVTHWPPLATGWRGRGAHCFAVENQFAAKNGQREEKTHTHERSHSVEKLSVRRCNGAIPSGNFTHIHRRLQFVVSDNKFQMRQCVYGDAVNE